MKISHAIMVASMGLCVWQAQANPTFSPDLTKPWSAPYLPEVLQHTPTLKQQVLAVLKNNGQLEDWVVEGLDDGPMVTTPVRPMLTSGPIVYTGTFCKPHDCGDTEWTFAYEPQKQALLLQRGEQDWFNAEGEKAHEALREIVRMSETLNQMWW